jgi:hypothetical protein
MLKLLFYTAVRVSELVRIQVVDIDTLCATNPTRPWSSRVPKCCS